MGLFGGLTNAFQDLANPTIPIVNKLTGSNKAGYYADPWLSLATSPSFGGVKHWLEGEAKMPYSEAKWWDDVLQGKQKRSLPALMASHDALHAGATRNLNHDNWFASHPDETAAMIFSLGSASGAFGGGGAAGGAGAGAGEGGSAAGEEAALAGNSSIGYGAGAGAGAGAEAGTGGASASYDLGADAYAGTGVGGGAGTASPASSSYDLGADAYAGTGIGDASMPYDLGSDAYAGTGVGGDIAPSDGSVGLGGSTGDLSGSSDTNPWYKDLLQKLGKSGGAGSKANYLKSAMGAMQLYGGLKQMQEKRGYDRQRQSYQDQINNMMRNPSSVTSSPEFLAGQQAIMRSMAAQGYQGSGNMAAALAGNAGTAYARQLARLAQLQESVPQMSSMQPIGNMGLGAYSMLSNI